MKCIFEVKLDAEKSNLLVEDSKLKDWRFNWKNNIITAFISCYLKESKDKSNSFEFLETPDKLGLLVDVLSFCTDLPISAKINYRLFKLDAKSRLDIFDKDLLWNNICAKVHELPLKENGDSNDDWPIRVNPSTSHNFNDQWLRKPKYLLDSLRETKFTSTAIKLLNYWRRGFDLDQLNYWDESFLVFYKILEYFEKRYKLGNNKIIDIKITSEKSKTKRKALRIIGGASEIKFSKYLFNLVTDCIRTRNNLDIAHMRIKPLPKNREGSLYFTYYFNIWDLHDDIKELARLFIIKYLKIPKLVLKNDGGLLKLSL